ncbi:phospholipase A1 VesT1.02-like [Vespa mandarinia]|uniref:phospholipase A1 VesT1.02-like n=1 Tax=Vespa mandarinia TaxID=7446 RepID=UPI0016201D12|nr:phospholipase A1 VesT1.02-like [Vespa mandarinia]
MKTRTKTYSDASDITMGSPFIFLALFCVLSLNLAKAEDIFYFSDDTGTTHVISVEDYDLTNEDITFLKANLSGVKFILYTRQNPIDGYILKLDDLPNLQNPDCTWNASNPTKIITHGWRGSHKSDSCVRVRDAYLTVGDYNVIVIDWENIASDILYSKVRACIPNVALYVAKFINYMQAVADLNPKNTLMVGHSLGSHLMSLAANNISDSIADVVGLDPAGPGYTNANPNNRIDKTHADYVQVIHTSSGRLGLKGNYGTADFHMNGGNTQPGCGVWDIIGKCSHARSYIYFSESIENPHGFRVTPVTCTRSSCPNVYMGGSSLDHNAQGSYTLATASEPPYALG